MLIGNFDGVHRGHQALIEKASAVATGPLTALTFTPHPRSFFNPDLKPFRLCDDHMRTELLKQYGVDSVLTLPFDRDLAELSASEFIDQILIERLQADQVIIGADFHFGKGRGGSTETLRADGRLDVQVLNLVEAGGAVISSSRIRLHLSAAEMEQVNALLGWKWCIRGPVIQGDQRGRLLGYPTANLDPGCLMLPAYGIYAVRVYVNGKRYQGVANIGQRPMYHLEKPLVETFIFDFNADIYGQTISVIPVKKLRDEAAFDGEEDLKKQMAQDVADARLALGHSFD